MGTRKNYIEKVKRICKSIISKGYDNLKKEFNEVYINKRKADAEIHGNISVEERLLNFNENSKINSKDRIILNSVIKKIKKEKYEFSNNDKEDLVLFNKKIDFAIAQCQYITNIYDGENNYVKGHSLDIVTLFNDIKSSTTVNVFLKNTQINNAFIKNANFKSFLIYLFALVKNIESKNSYPIYYKYYQNIAKFFFNIELLDYDNFCLHFREYNFNREPNLLEFNTYYYLLGENLKKELKLNGLSNEDVDKRWLKNNLFNIDSDSIESVDVSIDAIENEFKKYLENKVSKTSVNKYLGGISFINNISLKIGLEKLFNWDSYDIDENKKVLFNDEEFSKQNTTGNNMYSAVINHYQKFLQFMEVKENTLQFEIPPIKPFENFKWRWAVTTPSEGINSPEILIGVLRVLYNHNGKKHATQQFQDDLLELQTELDTKIDLAKVKRGLNKNIIENSGQYWKALGLLENSTGGIVNLTHLGNSIAEGRTSYDEFIKHLYSNFKLPNLNIESNEIIQKWRDNNIEILPIKLIFNILFEIKHQTKSPSNCYITPEELKDIIIPLSVYSKLPTTQFVNEILSYRKITEPYKSWPDCTPGDNDFRMVKEYLLFLSNFGFLDVLELKDKSKRYYLNAKSINILEEYYEPIVNNPNVQIEVKDQIPFVIHSFQDDCKNAGLVYEDNLITRFVGSLLTKPFVILTGLSGSGKTKLAQAYVQWICQEESQYRIIPVGADWTNREPLLGYPNALKPEEYVKPESGVIDVILRANKNPELPHFLILDEMNLSHVERYFADFLSVMESNEEIPLYAEGTLDNGVPSKLKVPANLFIIGTVNIDETTNMFSPKVLDRANTIEFRINNEQMDVFLGTVKNLNMKALRGKGANMSKNFISLSKNKSFSTKDRDEINNTLLKFFDELQKTGAEFGYRSANEILRLINQLDTLNNKFSTSQKIDIAIMQKLLPKLHGSRRKLSPILETLGSFCLTKDLKVVKDVFDKDDFNYSNPKVLYPLSLEKIARMYRGAVDNGFASYAEA